MSCSCTTSCGKVPCRFGEKRPAIRTGDLVVAHVRFADDRDFEAHRKHDTEARKVADEKYLRSSTELCQTKFSEFQARRKLRDEDMVLKQAISILQNLAHVGEATAGKACVLLGLGGRTLVDACNLAAVPFLLSR